MAGLAFDTVDFVGDGEQFNLGAHLEGAEATAPVFVGIDGRWFGYSQGDGVFEVILKIDHIGVVIDA